MQMYHCIPNFPSNFTLKGLKKKKKDQRRYLPKINDIYAISVDSRKCHWCHDLSDCSWLLSMNYPSPFKGKVSLRAWLHPDTQAVSSSCNRERDLRILSVPHNHHVLHAPQIDSKRKLVLIKALQHSLAALPLDRATLYVSKNYFAGIS